jgi:hypothetical protein
MQQNSYQRISELARQHHVSKSSIYLWIRTGDIPTDAVRRDRGVVLINAGRFADLINAGRLNSSSGRRILGRDNLAELLHVLAE